MPVLDGVETTKQLHDKGNDCKVLALTMFGDEKYYYQMIQAGVKGFVLKSSGISELLKAINEVYEGRSYFSNELLVRLVAGFSNLKENIAGLPESISKREIEVLKLIAVGCTSEEVAGKLYISTSTVRTHRANLLNKTGCGNTASLVMYAIKNKFVEIN
jgi:DNA-binding NarL/FixJ family response regulator